MPNVERDLTIEALDGGSVVADVNEFLKLCHADLENKKKDSSLPRVITIKVEMFDDPTGRTVIDSTVKIKLAEDHAARKRRVVGDLKMDKSQLKIVFPKPEKGEAA